MNIPKPHFLLFSETSTTARDVAANVGQWRFRLESVDGSDELEAADDEPELDGARLELLAVVRGLEALDQPSRVTLVTSSQYVSRGLRFGLDAWRRNDWQWERFGEMTPVSDRDLWQRVDRALNYHQVECRTWRIDTAHAPSRAASPRVIRFPQAEDHPEVEHQDASDGQPTDRRRLAGGALRIVRNCFPLRLAR